MVEAGGGIGSYIRRAFTAPRQRFVNKRCPTFTPNPTRMKTIGYQLARAGFCALVALCFISHSTAQLVFVPDTSLRSALNVWVPGAVDASGYLDTGNPAVLAQNTMQLGVNWTPADLTGIDALGNLTSLSITGLCFDLMSGEYGPCDSDSISIPNWPVGLSSLRLYKGTWGMFPPFPVDLSSLYLDVKGLSVIPPVPNGVVGLTVFDQPTLTALPAIPSSVEYLSLTSRGNAFPTLPEGITWLSLNGYGTALVACPPLPDSIDSLSLYNITNTSIPQWPASAQTIIVDRMPNLSQLAPWPSGLQHLRLSGLESLPSILPFPPSLEQLELWGLHMLDSLPAWPNGIQSIFVADLPVTVLPPFPSSVDNLDISYLGQLACLPLLPDGLTALYIDSDVGLPLTHTPLTCLPNHPPALVLYWGDLSPTTFNPDMLCTSLNSTCDFLNPAATGTTYWDQNANATRDAGEPGYPYVTLHQQPGSAMHGVAGDGTYAWPMPIGDYTLSASANNPYVQSIAPAQHALSFTAAGEVSTGNDFGVVLQPNVQDLRIDLTGPWGQPGFDSYGTITCENVGTMAVDATVTFQLDAVQSWVSAMPVPLSVVGNTITWDLPALQVGEARQIDLVAHTDSTVDLGTPLVQTAEVGPVASDATPSDNMSTVNTEVFGSFDPNDKQVQPVALSSAAVVAGNDELTYTVRFQNTGTWPAVKAMVVDTLSPDLQWSTFRKISSSHACSWELSDAGVLTFQFDPIDLPDSTNNEAQSHGFVKFAIKPATTLQLGMTVANSADIYFDFNVPVRTPAAVFTVDDQATVSEILPAMMQIYPNPVRDVLWVELNTTAQTTLQIFDAMGREHSSKNVSFGGVINVDVNGLAPGPYSLRCTSKEGIGSAKFMKR